MGEIRKGILAGGQIGLPLCGALSRGGVRGGALAPGASAPQSPAASGPLARMRRGRAWVFSESPAGNPSPRASSFLLLPAACRAPPPCSRAPSLLFPSPGRRLLLLLPFSLDLSLPARNPFRPGSRSGLAAVCPTPWRSGGRSSRASVRWCARLAAGPGERPCSAPRDPCPGRRGEAPARGHPGVRSPGRWGLLSTPSTSTPRAEPRSLSAGRAHGDLPSAAFCYDAAGCGSWAGVAGVLPARGSPPVHPPLRAPLEQRALLEPPGRV